jgi:hypothetical protein
VPDAETTDRALLNQLAEQARHWQDIDDLREHQQALRHRSSTMEQFTEFAVRVTLPGYSPRTIKCARFEGDAIRTYDHEVALHGEACVEILRRQVKCTDWVAGKLPPPLLRDEGLACDPTLIPAPRVEDTGSIDTYEEAR